MAKNLNDRKLVEVPVAPAMPSTTATAALIRWYAGEISRILNNRIERASPDSGSVEAGHRVQGLLSDLMCLHELLASWNCGCGEAETPEPAGMVCALRDFFEHRGVLLQV